MLNDSTPPPNGAEEPLTPLQRAAIALKELRTRLDAAEQANAEPVAVVGMACRFPGGGNDPAAFWQALRAGVDGVSEVPRERWDVDAFHDPDPDRIGKHSSRYGSFLPHVDQFDAAFFGISPREATLMDPQQRLLLEVSWEALEGAGIAPERLRGGPTGVFVGMMYQDYALLTLQPEVMDIYTGTGQAMSVAAGRIAYFLGVHGPALTVDTSCSSSLVAIHLACQSLRQGECTTALAAGVNLILTPHHSISESRARMLAPDGRCKSFDAAADGFGRGEGCGVVVLKRLSQARADGDTILALIRGSAVNHDGRTSGLTVPNEQAQAAVIRQALAKAHVTPDQIGYIEAHGTGTSLGDPIEVGALARLFGQRSHPLYLGSVKSNFGHLEGAAGIIAFIKTALLLHHGEIPPHLHLRTPNPHIPWADLPFVIPTSCLSWPDGQPRLAGVSSFGASGTNAHLILEGIAAVPPSPAESSHTPTLLTVSAANEGALRVLAERYADQLAHTPAPFATVAAASWLTRAHLPVRASVLASDTAEAEHALRAVAAGQRHRAVFSGSVTPTTPAVAFLFTGQGTQQHGMGRTLYERLPTFRAAFDECADALRPLLPHPLPDVLWGEPRAHHLETLPYAQAALFALQYALHRLWGAWGLSPTWLLGHSAGEYMAACAAGVLSITDALRLMVTRGQLAHALPTAGAMAVVFAGEDEVVPLLEPESGVVIAVINGPENLVLSGPQAAMDETLARLQAIPLRVRRLPIAQAFHAPHIAPIVAPFEQVARTVPYQPPTQRIFSTLLGGPATTELATPEYWSRHLREPVRFAAALQALAQTGATCFLEIGPASTLLSLGRQSLPEARYRWLPSLRPNQEWQQLLTTLATLYTMGAEIRWEQIAQDLGIDSFRLPLPTYPWQRQRYWVAATAPASPSTSPVLSALHQGSPKALVQLLAGDERMSAEQRTHLHTLALRLLAQHQQPPAQANVVQWGYTLAEENQPLDGAADLLPPPAALIADLPTPPALTHPDLTAYGALLTTLETRSHLWASRAVQELEATPTGILPRYHRLLARLIALANGGGNEERSPLPQTPETELLERCGPHLAAVLRGEQEPLTLLFPDGDLSVATHLYQETPVAQAMNALVRATVERALAAVPAHRRLRILEIGAGTGGTTAALLPHLDPQRVRYTLTDLGASFLSHAEARFGSYPFVSFQRLDIEQEPIPQGFAPQGYDLILAANVLHATRDLRQTLRHVQHLLAPGGLLVLLEGSAPQGWLDLTFGLTEGWWRFEDVALRPDYPLLSSAQWVSLLRESGFAAANALEPATMKGAPPAAALLQQAVVIAQAAPAPAPTAPRRWLLLGDTRGIGSALAAQLRAAGDACTLLLHPSTTLPLPAEHDLTGIIHLAPVGAAPTDPRPTARAVIDEALPLVQHLLTWATPPPLWLVTCGAVAAEAPDGVAQASLWGMQRVLSHEHPDLPCTILDLPSEPDPVQAAGWLYDELLVATKESQLLYRQGERRVLRLAPWQAPAAPPLTVRDNRSYLITGAFGGLGPLLARWLVARGARSLVLVGRRGPTPAHASLLHELRSAGATVQALALDVSDVAQVSRLFATLTETMPPLRGIIHGAGTLDDGALPSLTPARFETVLAPKLWGAWNLHEQTRHQPLDFFVLLSSAAALLGNRGQANHAAANAALDALAHYRRAQALPALTLNLGAVGEVGAAANRETETRLREQGIRPMAPARFVEWFEQALAAAPTQLAILTMEWARFRSPSRLFAHLDIAAPAPPETIRVATPLAWEATPPAERLARLGQEVAAAVQHVLRLDPQQRLPTTAGFFTLGMDSLTSVELRNELQTRLGLRLPSTLAFDHPTIERLVAHLAETLAPTAPPTSDEPANEAVAEILSSLADLSDDDIYTRLATSS